MARNRESQIQTDIADSLRKLGHTVLTLGTRARPFLGKGKFRGTSQTPGTPDLFVLPRKQPNGFWIGLEVKGPTTKVRDKQREFAKAGKIHLVRSTEEAIEVVSKQLDIRVAKQTALPGMELIKCPHCGLPASNRRRLDPTIICPACGTEYTR